MLGFPRHHESNNAPHTDDVDVAHDGSSLRRGDQDGGRVLVEVDLLEISATSTPMHPATRALSWKSTDAEFREAVATILTEGVTETKGAEPLKIATFEC